jgi:ribosomal protein S18 acetylase RimI-like enzyme
MHLAPMSEEDFLQFRERAIGTYAIERIASGEWSPDEAAARSAQAWQALLPQGRDTPGHRMMTIMAMSPPEAAATGATEIEIGTLWWQRRRRGGQPAAHLLDLFIKPEHRRLGHARMAFRLLEDLLVSEGLMVLSLNVFGRNEPAIRLYRDLGCEVASVEMTRTLGVTPRATQA